MSHRWGCTPEWEARAEGERAFDRGASYYGANPYASYNEYGDQGERRRCEDAEEAWRAGYRSAENRAEEEEAERHAAARREAERREMTAQEEAYYEAESQRYQQEQWEEPPPPEEEPAPDEGSAS